MHMRDSAMDVVSVCLSVSVTHTDIESKLIIVGLRGFHVRRVAQEL